MEEEKILKCKDATYGLSSLKKSISNAFIYARAGCDNDDEFIQFQWNNVLSKGNNVLRTNTRKQPKKIRPESFKKSIARRIMDLEKTSRCILHQLKMNAYKLKVIGNDHYMQIIQYHLTMPRWSIQGYEHHSSQSGTYFILMASSPKLGDLHHLWKLKTAWMMWR